MAGRWKKPAHYHSRNMPRLNILFLCTAHNSLSQRLFLELEKDGHHVTVEYAISETIMIEATMLAKPDLIIAPFLTKKVPAQVYEQYLTLIIHPGPPGDAGPSAMDWMLLGDDGLESDPAKALELITDNEVVARKYGRSHWGLTVLQAVEEFDAGPVWAWDQFPVTLDGVGAPTKASLYRGPITSVAISSCKMAIQRIVEISAGRAISPTLVPLPFWQQACTSTGKAFQGGPTLSRPLLKPAERSWDPTVHSAALISRRLRASDSQPGVQSLVLGKNLYLYGGIIEENPLPLHNVKPGSIVASRDGAVLLSTADGKGIWITHLRRLKAKTEALLPAKVPAMQALRSMPDMVDLHQLDNLLEWKLDGFAPVSGTFQEVWVDYKIQGGVKTAHVYSNFYNGAASTSQCIQLYAAIQSALASEIGALVLMGGSYFNNGIHLGVCSEEVGPESWKNINAINDCVQAILETRDVVTFAAIRGNIAAGGVALATCCDFVIATDNAVLNPHYRAVGLYGSEYHSLTWNARAGEEQTRKMMKGMLPMSAHHAYEHGLVDCVVSSGDGMAGIYSAIEQVITRANTEKVKGAPWVQPMDSDEAEPFSWTAAIRCRKDAWFSQLPQPLSEYRRQELDYMKLCFIDGRYHACVKSFVGKEAPKATPFRFALHRRHQHWCTVNHDAGEAAEYFEYSFVDSDTVNRALSIEGGEAIRPCQPPPLNWSMDGFMPPRIIRRSATPSSTTLSSDGNLPRTPTSVPAPLVTDETVTLASSSPSATPSLILKAKRRQTFVKTLKRIIRGQDKENLNNVPVVPRPVTPKLIIPKSPNVRNRRGTVTAPTTPIARASRFASMGSLRAVAAAAAHDGKTPTVEPVHMMPCYYSG